MIHPDEIVARAVRIYPRAVAATLNCIGNGAGSYFPLRLASDLKLPESHAELVRQVELLESRSKSRLGYGYTVQRQLRKSRSHGENLFPHSIVIETMEDLTRLAKKTAEYQRLLALIGQLRERLPELNNWAVTNWKKLLSIAVDFEQLIQVVEWLKENPRPDCFPRELPLAISTKLIEQHWPILASWLDIALPHSAINFGCDPKDYARRYGFRWAQLHIPIRLLDKSLVSRLGMPFSEFSLPLHELQRFTWLPDHVKKLVIVENKINLLTFPLMHDSIAMGGVGNAITLLSEVAWISKMDVVYWGDVDVEGFEILARLRDAVPQLRSFLMDAQSLEKFRSLAVSGNGKESTTPARLTEEEKLAFDQCQRHNIRLEQERIPQAHVILAATTI